jgi:hypothetical protein
MDKEYLDYNALSRSAIADIKNLDRKNSRFLQMMKVKLTTHRKNLEINIMGHCITSDEMVREHWLPLLTEMAEEDWLKTPNRESPLWAQHLDHTQVGHNNTNTPDAVKKSQPI